VRLWPITPKSESLLEVPRVFVAVDDGYRELTFRSRRRGGRCFIVAFEGVSDREALEKLNGQEVWIDKSELPELDDVDEFYLHQLLGLAVWTADGEHLGAVTEVLETGGSDVLVVGSESGEEVMIPFVGAMVTVDLEARKVLVDPPEGLLEATRTGGGGKLDASEAG
jgi:16S rRNA processing protein RimM